MWQTLALVRRLLSVQAQTARPQLSQLLVHAGGTTVGTSTSAGKKVILVASVEGFNPGQTITIGSGRNLETAVIAAVAPGRRRFGGAPGSMPADTITVTVPLKYGHAVGAQVSGSGITLASPLTMAHENGTQIASNLPTPGEPNQYIRKP